MMTMMKTMIVVVLCCALHHCCVHVHAFGGVVTTSPLLVARRRGGCSTTTTATTTTTTTTTSLAAAPATIEKPSTVEKQKTTDRKASQDAGTKLPAFLLRLWNDPYNKREFVARCLAEVCGKSDTESFQIMMQAHQAGMGIIGQYDLEIAELYLQSLKERSLLVDMVPVEDE
eukprot:scaffold25421_cov162-Amphora_coffeaeformis.AAC.1